MPRPIPLPVRQAIWRRYQDGQDGSTIARALDLPPRTVRHLLDRFGRGDPALLAPSYDRCGAATPKPDEALVRAALDLRRQHPTWGAGLIRVMLGHRLPEDPLPTTRTLQRWFHRAGLSPRRRGADPPPTRAGRSGLTRSGRWTRPSW